MEENVSSGNSLETSIIIKLEEARAKSRSSDSCVESETKTDGQAITPASYGKNLTDLHSESDVGQKFNDDYYEVISADGSIGGDDEDDIHDSDNLIDNLAHGALHNTEKKQCSIVDLPFVPQFEFVDESNLDGSSSTHSVASTSGALRVNRFNFSHRPSTSRNFSVPPPFNLGLPPSSIDLSVPPPPLPNLAFPPPSVNVENFQNKHVSGVKGQEIEQMSKPTSSDSDFSHAPESVTAENVSTNSPVSNPLASDHQSGIKKKESGRKTVSDWVDENGDPLPGAFDDVSVHSNEDVSVDGDKSAKVEYVFSVREKKNEPYKNPISAFSLMNSNVSLQNAAGNLGFSLGNKLAPPVSSDTVSYDADEVKKLYEASKSGAEYKAAIQSSSASTAAAPLSSTQKIITDNESVKNERFNRFKRNRFTDKKDDEPEVDSKEEPPKSQEEQALESQAVTEILKEVQRGSVRAREYGALGWQKCPVPVTNKTFLRNTLVSTLREPYKPPNKRGRFHVGLQGDRGQRKDDDDDSSSRSSRSSRSRSFSRSRRSYSYSSSRSSHSSDERRGSRRQGKHDQKGPWPGGQDEYYDWAAYAAHYGYQWYGPEAYGMYYGGEGWPMEAYTAMYYGDPQAWADYEAYYGPQNFNSRGRGRGMRGRGRGERFRGRGGFPDNFREYNQDFRSRSRDFSRSPSRSRSRRSRSYSQGLSRRDRSRDSRKRSETRSPSRSRRRTRSREGSKEDGSRGNSRSVSEPAEKKKKKKKKKKHRKSKKSKHKSKRGEEENEKESQGVKEMDESKEEREKKGEENETNTGKQDEDGIKTKKEKKKKHRKEKDGEMKGKHSRHRSTEKESNAMKSKEDEKAEKRSEHRSKEDSKCKTSGGDDPGSGESGEKVKAVDHRDEQHVSKGKRWEDNKSQKDNSHDKLNRPKKKVDQDKKADYSKDSKRLIVKVGDVRIKDKTVGSKLKDGGQSSKSNDKVENKNDVEQDKQKKGKGKEESNPRNDKEGVSINRPSNRSEDSRDQGREKRSVSGSRYSQGSKEGKRSVKETHKKDANAEGRSRDGDNSRVSENADKVKYDAKDRQFDSAGSSTSKTKGKGDKDSVQLKKSQDTSRDRDRHEYGKNRHSTEGGKGERYQTGLSEQEKGEKRGNAGEKKKSSRLDETTSFETVPNQQEGGHIGKGNKEGRSRPTESVKLSPKERSNKKIKKNFDSSDKLSKKMQESRPTGTGDKTVSVESKQDSRFEEKKSETTTKTNMSKDKSVGRGERESDKETEKSGGGPEIDENCKNKESKSDQTEKIIDSKVEANFNSIPNNESRDNNISPEDEKVNVSGVGKGMKRKKKIVKGKSNVKVKKKKANQPSEGVEADLSNQRAVESADVGNSETTVKRTKEIGKLKSEKSPPAKKRKTQEDTKTVDLKADGL